MCALDGYLYAFGGWVGEDIGGTIERYNPTKDQWEYLTKMQEPRFSMGICVYDSLIYLVGGCTHSRRHMQELVSYNPVNLLFFLTIFDRDFTSWSQELFFFSLCTFTFHISLEFLFPLFYLDLYSLFYPFFCLEFYFNLLFGPFFQLLSNFFYSLWITSKNLFL